MNYIIEIGWTTCRLVRTEEGLRHLDADLLGVGDRELVRLRFNDFGKIGVDAT